MSASTRSPRKIGRALPYQSTQLALHWSLTGPAPRECNSPTGCSASDRLRKNSTAADSPRLALHPARRTPTVGRPSKPSSRPVAR
jgi:hypothetical protein